MCLTAYTCTCTICNYKGTCIHACTHIHVLYMYMYTCPYAVYQLKADSIQIWIFYMDWINVTLQRSMYIL